MAPEQEKKCLLPQIKCYNCNNNFTKINKTQIAGISVNSALNAECPHLLNCTSWGFFISRVDKIIFMVYSKSVR